MNKQLVAIILLTTVFFPNAHSETKAQHASAGWTFDYTVNGAREARPQVHGDKAEMYLQFPDNVKPKEFSVKPCHSTKGRKVNFVTRGPYYVIQSPAGSLRVKTNHGTIYVNNNDPQICAKKSKPLFETASVVANSKSAKKPGSTSKSKYDYITKADQKRSREALKKKSLAKSNSKTSGKKNRLKNKVTKKPLAKKTATAIKYVLHVRSGSSLRTTLSKKLQDWGLNLSWGLSHDRVSSRDFRFTANSPNEAVNQALKVFQLKGWFAADSRTVYILKESEQ